MTTRDVIDVRSLSPPTAWPAALHQTPAQYSLRADEESLGSRVACRLGLMASFDEWFLSAEIRKHSLCP